MPRYEIEKTLVVSTAHITKKDSDLLQRGELPFPVINPDYGHIVSTFMFRDYTDDRYLLDIESCVEAGLSPSFMFVMHLAAHLGCHKVHFDCDGPELSNVRIFDW